MARDTASLFFAVDVAACVGAFPATFSALCVDSRLVTPGALYVAIRGARADGHDFAAAAVAAGAAGLVVDHELPLDVPQYVVPDTTRAISQLADVWYDRPSEQLVIVGITGTNGKTTTTHLVRSVLEASGLACGVIGTLGGEFGAHRWPLENTTPLPLDVHRVLAEMRTAGADVVAMEVSSHALALGRVDDVRFRVAVLTNITRDHLDFHGTFEAYRAAKRRLFDLAARAVLNVDDPAGADFAREFPSAVTYAIDAPANVRAEALSIRVDGSTFTVDGSPVRLRLPGRFNCANALAALGVARALGIDNKTACSALERVAPVPGRMERFEARGVTAIVDYAHTPDALENVLRTMREITSGRVIVVFGCGGDRDPGKRPIMGRIATEHADIAIVTSDNPRSEDPAAIAAEVAGTTGARIVLDRRAAIAAGIETAQPGDVVVIAGKGHEDHQIVGGTRAPFDDRVEVRVALERAAGAAV